LAIIGNLQHEKEIITIEKTP